MLPHDTSPDAQAHVPAWHVVPLPQACPQLPQFALSVFRSTQAPLHALSPTSQFLAQPVPEQT
jgi:hypothetical protein